MIVTVVSIFCAGIEFDACLKSESPSSRNIRCQQFQASMGEESMPKRGESIMIIYGSRRKKMRTICYHLQASKETMKVAQNILWCLSSSVQVSMAGAAPACPMQSLEPPATVRMASLPPRIRTWSPWSGPPGTGDSVPICANRLRERHTD